MPAKSNESIARDLNEKGVEYFKQKKYSEAINAFDQALIYNANDTTIKNNREFAQKKLVKSVIFGVFYLIFIAVMIGAAIGIVFGFIHLPISQSITPSTSSQTPDDNTKALLISQAIDYPSPVVKNFANQQVHRSSTGEYNINQIGDVWQSIYNQWTYVSDPNFNYYTPASDSIKNGLKGNCLDYAILNAAVIESIGGTSRVVTACAPNGGPCHAYAEVFLGTNLARLSLANVVSGDQQSELDKDTASICSRYHCKSIHYHTYSNAQGNTEYWLNLDWSATYPGGPFFQDDGTIQVFYPNGFHVTSNT